MNIPEYEFTRRYEINELNDTPAVCSFGVDRYSKVTLDTVNISGMTVTATTFREWLGGYEADRLTAFAQRWWSVEGGAEKVEMEYADRRADDRNDRMDD